MNAVKLTEKYAKFTDHWHPRIVAQINNHQVKLAKVKGEFVWHSHPETDELFWVHKGLLTIQLRHREVQLGPGEMFVVPKGAEHKPVAEDECEILMFEPSGTVNTGEAGGEHTCNGEDWI